MSPKQKFFVLMSVVMLFVFAAGCMLDGKAKKSNNDVNTVLKIAYSDSTKELTEELKKGFLEKYPDVTIIAITKTSDELVYSLLDKSSNIAFISRNLTNEEKKQGIEEYILNNSDFTAVVMNSEIKQNELVMTWFEYLNTVEAKKIIDKIL